MTTGSESVCMCYAMIGYGIRQVCIRVGTGDK